MSEAMTIPPLGETAQKRTPTVYFIDDSATMREVIKIAFRRENINVITCADAASALAQFEQNRPDVVITDVIMPDKDGYSVCSEIKQHADYGAIPVVLMSGVVNKTVADKAVSVRADELIRKPFQPQELILRVKSLLQPKSAEFAGLSNKPAAPGLSLDKLFAPAPSAQPQSALPSAPRPSVVPPPSSTPESAWPRALAEAFTPRPAAQPGTPASAGSMSAANQADQSSRSASAEEKKLRAEITFLDTLVKKLQTELHNERQYNQSLEQQIRTLASGD